MSKTICENPNPSEVEVLQTLCEGASGKFLRFRYKPLPECRKKVTASVAAAKADTLIVGNPEIMAGYVQKRKLGGKVGDAFSVTKAGNLILNLRSTTRRKKLATGTGYYADKSNKQEDGSRKTGYVKDEFMPRSVRLDRQPFHGIDLSTVEVSQGGRKKGLVRLFPNVQPMV
jgi:hypothetical protein